MYSRTSILHLIRSLAHVAIDSYVHEVVEVIRRLSFRQRGFVLRVRGFPCRAQYCIVLDGMRSFLCGLDHLAVAGRSFAPWAFVKMVVIELVYLAPFGVVVDSGVFVSAADESRTFALSALYRVPSAKDRFEIFLKCYSCHTMFND